MIKIVSRLTTFAAGLAFAASSSALRPSFAQDHSQMHHEQEAVPTNAKAARTKKPGRKTKLMSDGSTTKHGKHSGPDVGGEHGNGGAHGSHEMKGFLGPYGMGREGSGTSWEPDISPHAGIHVQYGDWMTMWHALFNG